MKFFIKNNLIFITLAKFLNFSLVKITSNSTRTSLISVNKYTLTYFLIHFRLSHFFFFSSLTELAAWQVFFGSQNQLVYFYTINLPLYAKHLVFFFLPSANTFKVKPASQTYLFFNLTWLERELKEMHGVRFENHFDNRNLLLMYNQTTAPLLKTYSSWGEEEIFYSNILEACELRPVSWQY